MLFMDVITYDPSKRDEVIKRVVEKGTSWVPEGMTLHGWWTVPGGGLGFMLAECDDINVMEMASLPCSDIVNIEIHPVTEVLKIMDLLKDVK